MPGSAERGHILEYGNIVALRILPRQNRCPSNGSSSMRLRPALILAAGLAASCAPTPPPPAPAAAPPKAAAVDARSCVDLARISEARVVDDRTIDFHMRDGTVLRNSLPNSCPSLGFEKAFTYSTSISRL